MFVLRSTHDRVVAERDAARADARRRYVAWEQEALRVDQLSRELDELKAELAHRPVRGERGRFQKRDAA